MENVTIQEVPTQEVPAKSETPVLHSFNEPKESGKDSMKKIGIIALVVALGTLTGYFLSNVQAGGGVLSLPTPAGGGNQVVQSGKTVGSTDTKTFRDQAEGKLEKGGIDGEGTHKLVRDPKRPDQTVYLTSSVVDLDQFVGKKVRVWGETNSAEKAGWFMDVGKVETL